METAALDPEIEASVESFLADWMVENRIPGAAVAIIEDDHVVYADGFGARDLEENAPATPDTLFPIGSCTKSFTALAIMQLVEDGALALDDPVDEYIPHLAGAPGEPITIEELLSHTSGMPSDGSALPLLSRTLGLGHVEVPLSSDADFRRHIADSTDRRVTEREELFYYNSGYTMLGLVIEAVSGASFSEYVTANVLDPLGMEQSTFDREAFESESDRTTAYVSGEDGAAESAFAFARFVEAPGGLVSSASELSRYLRMYLNRGALEGEHIASAEYIDAMTAPIAVKDVQFGGPSAHYGYGLMMRDFLDDTLVGHGGSVAVSTAWFGYLQEAGRGVVLLASTGPDTHPMVAGPAVLAMLDGAAPAEEIAHYRLREVLERVTGEYEGYRAITTATVERVGGSLRVELDNGPLGGTEVLVTPKTSNGEALVGHTVTELGIEREMRFQFGEHGVDLFFERMRLRKSGTSDPGS